MIQNFADQFVGIAAVCVGLFVGAAAATNWPWYYTLRSARFLEARLGRTGARMVHAVVALGLIALGIAIATGHRYPVFG